MKTLAISMQKGGTGKTTTALNLGAALHERGKSVLLVDLDPQANLTSAFGLKSDQLQSTIYNPIASLAREADLGDLDSLIHSTSIGPDLIPSGIELALAELDLQSAIRREYIVKTLLEGIQQRYDYLLIDCPPSLGILVVNALAAADAVIIPVQVEYLAARGVAILLQLIERVRRSKLNPDLAIAGILLTMADKRTLLARDIIAETRKTYHDVHIFDTVVWRSVRFSESNVASQSILQYDTQHEGAQAYRAIAEEVIALG